MLDSWASSLSYTLNKGSEKHSLSLSLQASEAGRAGPRGLEDTLTAPVTHIPSPSLPHPVHPAPFLQLSIFNPTLGVSFSIPSVALLSACLLSDISIPD